MSKQFLNVPVENAKELIERFIADPAHGLTAYAGATVAYVEEVIIHHADLEIIQPSPDPNVIYFGTLVMGDPTDAFTYKVDDGNNNVTTLDVQGGTTGCYSFDCVMFNAMTANPTKGYFYGYKFSITV